MKDEKHKAGVLAAMADFEKTRQNRLRCKKGYVGTTRRKKQPQFSAEKQEKFFYEHRQITKSD
jgi:hypothetical protein